MIGVSVGMWAFYPISRFMRSRLAVAVPFRQAQELHLAKKIAREEAAKQQQQQHQHQQLQLQQQNTSNGKKWWFF